MRVQLRHLIEQLLLGCCGFLQPIKVLQVTLGVLDRRRGVGARQASCDRPQQLRGSAPLNGLAAAIQFFRLSGVVSPTYMRHWLYTTSPATIRPIDGTCRDVESGLSVRPCSMMRNSWPSRVNVSCSYGSGGTNLVGICPGKTRRANCSTGGSERRLHGANCLGRSNRPGARETVEENAQAVEVIEMGVSYIDGLQVAVVQSDPIRESLGLSHCPHCVHQHRVVLAED